MPNSIFSQLDRALGQAAKSWDRSILYRGIVIACVVSTGSSFQALSVGGIQDNSTASVKVQKALVPIGSDGAPFNNELVVYPAYQVSGLLPKRYMIASVIEDEYSYGFELVDPSK